jgi:hypothetical protein
MHRALGKELTEASRGSNRADSTLDKSAAQCL